MGPAAYHTSSKQYHATHSCNIDVPARAGMDRTLYGGITMGVCASCELVQVRQVMYTCV